jgi:hypothetical protein
MSSPKINPFEYRKRLDMATDEIKEANQRIKDEVHRCTLRWQKAHDLDTPVKDKTLSDRRANVLERDLNAFRIDFREHIRGALLLLQEMLSAGHERNDLWEDWALRGGDVAQPSADGKDDEGEDDDTGTVDTDMTSDTV